MCVCVCENCVSLDSLPRIAVLTAGYKGLFTIVKIKPMLLLLLLLLMPMFSEDIVDVSIGVRRLADILTLMLKVIPLKLFYYQTSFESWRNEHS